MTKTHKGIVNLKYPITLNNVKNEYIYLKQSDNFKKCKRLIKVDKNKDFDCAHKGIQRNSPYSNKGA